MPRRQLDQALRALDLEVVRVGRLVQQALREVQPALRGGSSAAALESARAVETAAREVQQQIFTLLTVQQPLMAGDLRRALLVQALAEELDRIGNHARELARASDRLRRLPALDLAPTIDEPFVIVREMLHLALRAYLEGDAALAEAGAARDEALDAWHQRIGGQLITRATETPGLIETVLLWNEIAHQLERLGDRASRVCQRVAANITERPASTGGATSPAQ
jgi:phosphate transport system protein